MNTRLVLLLASLLVILGTLSIISVHASPIPVAQALSAILLIGGILWALFGLAIISHEGALWGIFGGLASIITGVLVFRDPHFPIAWFFGAAGLLKIIFAIQTQSVRGWDWVMINGMVTFLLGIMIWKQWPIHGWLATLTYAGVDLHLAGYSLIRIGILGREEAIRSRLERLAE